jgi:hypothetical protein
MTEGEPVVARVTAMADRRGLARCGQPRCGAVLGYVLDYETPTWLSAWVTSSTATSGGVLSTTASSGFGPSAS